MNLHGTLPFSFLKITTFKLLDMDARQIGGYPYEGVFSYLKLINPVRRGSVMPRIPDDIMQEIDSISVIDYMERNYPGELIKCGLDCYKWSEHDSMKFMDEGNSYVGWYWHSRSPQHGGGDRYCGRDALSFIRDVEIPEGIHGHSPGEDWSKVFRDVCSELYSSCLGKDLEAEIAKRPEDRTPSKKAKSSFRQTYKRPERKLEMPPKDTSNEYAYNYLTSRGIDGNIVKDLMNKGLIYGSTDPYRHQFHNVAFVGMKNMKNEPGSVTWRACSDKKDRGDAKGSQKKFSFHLEPESMAVDNVNMTGGVHVFESPIDLLSYATLEKMAGRDYTSECLVSLNGVTSMTEDRLPASLDNWWNTHPVGTESITISLHFDNDTAGREAAKTIEKFFKNHTHNASILTSDMKIEVVNETEKMAFKEKDVNEYLQHLILPEPLKATPWLTNPERKMMKKTSVAFANMAFDYDPKSAAQNFVNRNKLAARTFNIFADRDDKAFGQMMDYIKSCKPDTPLDKMNDDEMRRASRVKNAGTVCQKIYSDSKEKYQVRMVHTQGPDEIKVEKTTEPASTPDENKSAKNYDDDGLR